MLSGSAFINGELSAYSNPIQNQRSNARSWTDIQTELISECTLKDLSNDMTRPSKLKIS